MPKLSLAVAAITIVLSAVTASLAAAMTGGLTSTLPVVDGGTTVSIGEARLRDCAAALQPAGTPGVATREWTAAATGLFTAELDGGSARDWDLAVFRPTGGDALAASTSFTSAEQASTWVRPGDRLVVQACRRTGETSAMPLELGFFAMPLPGGSKERFSLEAVSISGPDDLARLEGLGLDITHDVTPTTATVALYSDVERARLAAEGFVSETLVRDMAAADAADRASEAEAAELAVPTALPSGRTGYRVYEDYTTEMKQLRDSNPSLVRVLTIGNTIEGRPIQALEIAADVERKDDGRPVYLNLGLHHAREWPSGEMPMEFAHDLVQGFAESPRIRDLLHRVRVIIVPVVNADGFIVSRTFGATPADGNSNATLPLIVADALSYKRKNCRPYAVDPAAAVPCVARPVGMGVDPNRNYGAYFGGVGSSTNPPEQSYRGTGPFSEPEVEAIHRLSSKIHPAVVISNHTFTAGGTWLRQPGFRNTTLFPGNLSPDESRMKQLGDSMATATGWASQLGWAIGDITGATEDWNYFAQGSLGYTPEGKGPNFHADYGTVVVNEYIGTGSRAGLGVREAYLRGVERAASAVDLGVVTGTAPPGAKLRLTKSFKLPTCLGSCTAPTLFLDEVLDTELTVPESGVYEWHVGPSGRPFAPNELWTMTCQIPGQEMRTGTLSVARGQRVTVDWRGGACGNEPPTASFEHSPAEPRGWDEVTFTSTSSDREGTDLSHEWDIDGDGEFDDGTDSTATWTFTEAGTYRVALRVTDSDGLTDEATLDLVVAEAPPNLEPTASFEMTPSVPRRGDSVLFQSGSSDPDGPLVSQDWDLDGDGAFDDAAGAEVTHVFGRAGRVRVSLRVTDRRGATATASRLVIVRG